MSRTNRLLSATFKLLKCEVSLLPLTCSLNRLNASLDKPNPSDKAHASPAGRSDQPAAPTEQPLATGPRPFFSQHGLQYPAPDSPGMAMVSVANANQAAQSTSQGASVSASVFLLFNHLTVCSAYRRSGQKHPPSQVEVEAVLLGNAALKVPEWTPDSRKGLKLQHLRGCLQTKFPYYGKLASSSQKNASNKVASFFLLTVLMLAHSEVWHSKR